MSGLSSAYGTGIVQNGAATPSTLTIGADNSNQTFGGTFQDGGSGSLAIVKTGTGSLKLNYVSSGFSGGVTVNQGTLILSANAGGSAVVGTDLVTVNAGATLACTNSDGGGNPLGGTPATPVYLNGGTLLPAQYNDINSLTMNAGTVAAVSTYALDFRNNASAVAPTITTSANASASVIAAGLTSGTSAPLTINVASGGGAGPDLLISGLITGGVPITKSGLGTLQITNASNYWNGGITVSSGLVQAGGGSTLGVGVTTLGGGTLQLYGSTAFTGVSLASAAPGGVIDVENSVSTTFSGGNSITSGTALITKTGSGTLTMVNGSPNFSGGVTINQGTIYLGTNPQGSPILGTGLVTINSGGTLNCDSTTGGNPFGTGTNCTPIFVNGGVMIPHEYTTINLLTMDAGTVTVGAGPLTFQNTGALTQASITTSANATTALIAAPISVAGTNGLNLTVAAGGAGPDLLISGQLTGSAVTKNGPGTVALTASNNTANLVLNAGVVQFSKGAISGNNNGVTFSGGTLQWASGNTQDGFNSIWAATSIPLGQTAYLDLNGNAISAQEVLTGAGTLFLSGGTVNWTSGSNMMPNGGGITVNSGRLIMSNPGGTPIAGTNTLTINAGAVVDAGNSTGGNPLGIPSAGLTPIFINGGTYIPHLYNHISTLTMNGGSVAVGPGTQGLYFDNPSTITTQANLSTAVIASPMILAGTNGMNLTVAAGGGAGPDLTISGNIQGVYAFNKNGAGSVLLTANNSLSGDFRINVGSAIVNGSLPSTANVVVNGYAGGTLSGSGSVGNVTAYGNGAALAPGYNGVGTLTANTVTLDSGSYLNYTLGSTAGSALLNVTSASGLTLGSGITLDVVPGTNWGNGSYELASYAGTISNTSNFSGWTVAGAGIGSHLYSFTATGGSLDVVVSATGATTVSGTWTNSAGGSWSTAGFWSGSQAPTTTGDTALFGSAVTSGTATVTLDGSHTLSGLTFNNTAASYSITTGTGGNLTLVATSGAVTLANSGGSHSISASIALGSNLNVTTVAGSKLAISGPVTQINAGTSLNLSGSGTLVLSGSDSYSGGTTVNSGTLDVNSAQALPTSGVVVVGRSGRVVLGNIVGAAEMVAASPLTSESISLASVPAVSSIDSSVAEQASSPAVQISVPTGAPVSGGPAAVPEPGTVLLLLVGAVALAVWRRRK
jgi:autotransporter-associated beta strand protein